MGMCDGCTHVLDIHLSMDVQIDAYTLVCLQMPVTAHDVLYAYGREMMCLLVASTMQYGYHVID